MTRSITAFEAPALLDAHSNITRLDLYERLIGAGLPKGSPGLSSFMSQAVMEFAAQDAGWRKLSRRDVTKDVAGIQGYASAWATSDADGEFVALFQHVAQYMHSTMWAKAGTPPRSVIVSATWTAMIHEVRRVAIVVLADKRIVIYWVEPTQEDFDSLKAAAADMARRVAEKDAPSVDSNDDAGTGAIVAKHDVDDQDMDSLITRWKATTELAADAANRSKLATAAADAATVLLQSKLPKGASHEVDGVKVTHNAKTGRLIEEKTDAAYF